MFDGRNRVLLPMACLAMGLCAIAIFCPGYLVGGQYLGTIVFIQILLAVIWDFRRRFLTFLILGFLWAGMGSLPLSTVWTSARWGVLIAGAIVGCAIYLHDARHHFDVFHLMAAFCVVAAIVSAMVSAFPQLALLKAVSLLLLFLYVSTGARLAVMGREDAFLRGTIFSVEILVYLSAACYLLFRFPVFGNPNSLGATMGVVAAPLFFWDVLSSSDVKARKRRTFAFALTLLLLFFSQARAGILGAITACFIVGLAARQFRFLLKAATAALFLAVLAVLLVPSGQLEDMPTRRQGSSIASVFLYKGKDEAGVLGSRKSPWDETISVIAANPWFGSGFGTTISDRHTELPSVAAFSSTSLTTREHGDSYLAILEGVGILGVLPFLALVLMFVVRALRVLWYSARNGGLRQVAVPVAMVLIAGFVHALFEDWLFAVGYYLCVFFWTLAFIFLDLAPRETAPQPAARLAIAPLPQQQYSFQR